MRNYDKIVDYWNKVFSKKEAQPIQTMSTGQKDLDLALDWLCKDSEVVLDFGCGNGGLLYRCYLRGAKELIGIDISKEAIALAKQIQYKSHLDNFRFFIGNTKSLAHEKDQSVDAVILSNILDNLFPEDALLLLQEVDRILQQNGKVLLKLNPFITHAEMTEKIRVIEGNLLDDGLYLWNQTNDEWLHLLGKYFHVHQYQEIYYQQYEQTNRLFLLTKKGTQPSNG